MISPAWLRQKHGEILADVRFAFGSARYVWQLPKAMVIVTNIGRELSNIEREVTLIVTHFWQLFSQILGETLLIVTHIWLNYTGFFLSVRS